eukprot:768534-Hanusia_phi.AAC.6
MSLLHMKIPWASFPIPHPSSLPPPPPPPPHNHHHHRSDRPIYITVADSLFLFFDKMPISLMIAHLACIIVSLVLPPSLAYLSLHLVWLHDIVAHKHARVQLLEAQGAVDASAKLDVLSHRPSEEREAENERSVRPPGRVEEEEEGKGEEEEDEGKGEEEEEAGKGGEEEEAGKGGEACDDGGGEREAACRSVVHRCDKILLPPPPPPPPLTSLGISLSNEAHGGSPSGRFLGTTLLLQLVADASQAEADLRVSSPGREDLRPSCRPSAQRISNVLPAPSSHPQPLPLTTSAPAILLHR